jgi:hypothetical protein
MSSTLALEESKFAKFRNNAEEAIFGVIYNIQKTRDFDLPRVNYLAGLAAILLDFVQIMPFLVHGRIFSEKFFLYCGHWETQSI